MSQSMRRPHSSVISARLTITIMSHNCCDISIHWHIYPLFNSLLSLTTKKHQSSAFLAPVGFPHTGPVMWRVFSCHDAIMQPVDECCNQANGGHQNATQLARDFYSINKVTKNLITIQLDWFSYAVMFMVSDDISPCQDLCKHLVTRFCKIFTEIPGASFTYIIYLSVGHE